MSFHSTENKHIQNKEDFVAFIQDLQNQICTAIEITDGNAKFEEDLWERPGGGGGRTRVIRNGNVFEKGGVNISTVHGQLPESMMNYFNTTHPFFFACGLSLVIHPLNPMVPTVHANIRYFELYNDKNEVIDCWFGGGADLTPYYVFPEDAVHFHHTFKNACDKFDKEYYDKFKIQCDRYFRNTHRNNEARGIGGVFYDYLKADEFHSWEDLADFSKHIGESLTDAYIPIVERRKTLLYDENQRYWQGIRRGRYAEFNLVHDKGTLFGLKTNGRTESILMSLPPHANWDYQYYPKEGTKEAETQEWLKPRDWTGDYTKIIQLD
jgi:coproporphyrinogen III oxidase